MRWLYLIVFAISFNLMSCMDEREPEREDSEQIYGDEKSMYDEGESGTGEEGYEESAESRETGEDGEVFGEEGEAIEAKADTLVNDVSEETQEIMD